MNPVERFIRITFRFGRGRAHEELDRAFDHGEGLALAIDDPSAVAPVLELHQIGFGGLQLLLLLPLAKRPFRCPVDACVGVVAIEVEQLVDQRFTLGG